MVQAHRDSASTYDGFTIMQLPVARAGAIFANAPTVQTTACIKAG